MPCNCTLKMGKTAIFGLHIFYHNKKQLQKMLWKYNRVNSWIRKDSGVGIRTSQKRSLLNRKKGKIFLDKGRVWTKERNMKMQSIFKGWQIGEGWSQREPELQPSKNPHSSESKKCYISCNLTTFICCIWYSPDYIIIQYIHFPILTRFQAVYSI